MRSFVLLAVLQLGSCHFTMVSPPTWHDAYGLIGTKPGGQCLAGCTGKHAPGQLEKAQGCSCEWYTNWTFVKTPTISRDSPLRTYTDTDRNGNPIGDWTCAGGYCKPWRAPGQAPINSPCGVDGGNAHGCPAGNPSGGNCAGGGYGNGPDSRTYNFSGVVTTTWKAGSTVETAWSITANHGGGFSYRLCKMPAGGKKDLTEECFQKNILTAVGDHTVVFENKTRSTFPAVRTTKDTFPAGSQWTRNPIPACKGPGGGSLLGSGSKCNGYQFPPPLGADKVPNVLGGFGNNDGDGGAHPGGVFYWHVVDKLQVPASLEPGSYVLSLRWDCEQTPQVWLSCSDIKITASDDVMV